jgi:hypothetical protein
MHKDYFGNQTTKMYYVEHFIMLMITKKLTTLQVISCIFGYNNAILNLNPKLQARRKLIIYNTINCIIALRKHVNSNHSNCFLKKLKKK